MGIDKLLFQSPPSSGSRARPLEGVAPSRNNDSFSPLHHRGAARGASSTRMRSAPRAVSVPSIIGEPRAAGNGWPIGRVENGFQSPPSSGSRARQRNIAVCGAAIVGFSPLHHRGAARGIAPDPSAGMPLDVSVPSIIGEPRAAEAHGVLCSRANLPFQSPPSSGSRARRRAHQLRDFMLIRFSPLHHRGAARGATLATGPIRGIWMFQSPPSSGSRARPTDQRRCPTDDCVSVPSIIGEPRAAEGLGQITARLHRFSPLHHRGAARGRSTIA